MRCDPTNVSSNIPSYSVKFSDENPNPGTNITKSYNLKEGWNELYFLNPNIENNWFQIGSITVKALSDISNRKYDPNEINIIRSLHFEAEQGKYTWTNNESRFYGDDYSGTELLGNIESSGCGTSVTFNVPSNGAGTYNFISRYGTDSDTTIQVTVEDLTHNSLNSYFINASSTGGYNSLANTSPIEIDVPNGECRISVEYYDHWFTIDSFDLYKSDATPEDEPIIPTPEPSEYKRISKDEYYNKTLGGLLGQFAGFLSGYEFV